jgi:MFS family permease
MTREGTVLTQLKAWGQAWITNRASFYITRALIGLFEGGFIPGTVNTRSNFKQEMLTQGEFAGVILFSTYFYTSKELSTRLAVFWSTLNVARVISALLAAGILKMRGTGGHPGWFWLFLLEGLLTCVIAVVVSPAFVNGVIIWIRVADNMHRRPSYGSLPAQPRPRASSGVIPGTRSEKRGLWST